MRLKVKRGLTRNQRRAANRVKLARWHFYLTLLPRRLLLDAGKEFQDAGEVAFCEIIARRSQDQDGLFPWIYGPSAWVLTQPHTRSLEVTTARFAG